MKTKDSEHIHFQIVILYIAIVFVFACHVLERNKNLKRFAEILKVQNSVLKNQKYALQVQNQQLEREGQLLDALGGAAPE